MTMLNARKAMKYSALKLFDFLEDDCEFNGFEEVSVPREVQIKRKRDLG